MLQIRSGIDLIAKGCVAIVMTGAAFMVVAKLCVMISFN